MQDVRSFRTVALVGGRERETFGRSPQAAKMSAEAFAKLSANVFAEIGQ